MRKKMILLGLAVMLSASCVLGCAGFVVVEPYYPSHPYYYGYYDPYFYFPGYYYGGYHHGHHGRHHHW